MFKTKLGLLAICLMGTIIILLSSIIYRQCPMVEILPTAPHIANVWAENMGDHTVLTIKFQAQVPEYSKLKVEISKDLNYNNSSKYLDSGTIDDWKAGHATVITSLQSGWIRLVVKNNRGYQVVGGSISFCSKACY